MCLGERCGEPTQDAVIAWNEEEEVMVLTTELQGSRKGKMLEIMPVPSRPAVTKGDPKLFAKTMSILKSKQARPPRRFLASPPSWW